MSLMSQAIKLSCYVTGNILCCCLIHQVFISLLVIQIRKIRHSFQGRKVSITTAQEAAIWQHREVNKLQ